MNRCLASRLGAIKLIVVSTIGLMILTLVVGCPPHGTRKPSTGGTARPQDDTIPFPVYDVWPPRAVWVPRQTYTSPDQIAELMERIRCAGLNTVLFQVRGNGTAFYRSAIEPLAEEYTDGDPGFDPLTVACREAHRRGMAIHAWVNVMPAWRGLSPSNSPNQLYNVHPDWFWYDQHGQRQPLGKFYVSLNPCLPEVRRYLVGVCREIIANYRVDGLHLDYIRFPTDESPKGSDYPRDRATLTLYRQATGKRPQDDPARWARWRTRQVTQLVSDIRTMMLRTRPRARLTVAAWPDVERARRDFFQDAPAWARGNLIDLALVMNYTSNTNTFRLRQQAWRRAAPRRPVAAGIGAYMHESDRITIDQLELTRHAGEGFALFSSNVLFDNAPRSRQRLAAIRPILLDMQTEARRQAKRTDSPIRAKIGITTRVGGTINTSRQPKHGVVP